MDDSGNIWRPPFESNMKFYGWKIIEEKFHQGQLKYNIQNRWYSKAKLNELSYRVDEKIQTNILKSKPFKY